MFNIINHFDEEYSNEAVPELKEKTLKAEEPIYDSEESSMQYSEPNYPILIQHDKHRSGGPIFSHDVLLSALLSKLALYSLQLTQVSIFDAAIDGLG